MEYKAESKPDKGPPEGARILKGAGEVYKYLKELGYADKEQEHFVAVFLGPRGDLISHMVVGIGNEENVSVATRAMFRAALKANAAGICCAHNHPSTESEPSDPDKVTTRNLVVASKLLDIEFLDHIVIAKNGFTSIRHLEPTIWGPPKNWRDYTSVMDRLVESLQGMGMPPEMILNGLRGMGLKEDE